MLLTNNFKSFLLLILFAVSSVPALPQDQDFKFQRYTVLDGLSPGYVQCIIQDQKGFMWFGTDKGLNRFDGYSFKTYNANQDDPTCIYNDRITTLFEDSKGRLWIGCSSPGGGLHIYNRDADNFIRVLPDPDYPLGQGGSNILAMAEDASGNIWLGTQIGVFKFNPDAEHREYKHINQQANCPPGIATNDVDVLYIDSENYVWFGTETGLYMFDSEKNSYYHFNHSEQDPYSLGDNRVEDIIEDNNGTLWIGTRDGGLNRLVWSDPVSKDPEDIKLIRYKNDLTDPNSISSNVINVLRIDGSGTLWIGTDEGINRFVEEDIGEFKSYQTNPLDNESLNYNTARSLYFDESGTMWVGTSTGLNKQKSYKFSHYKQDISESSLASNKIQAIFEDDNDDIWIGSSKGLNFFNKRSNTFKFIIPGAIMSISQDQEGFFWIGQWHNGLIKYNPSTGQSVNFRNNGSDSTSLGDNNIFTTYVDSDNDAWICTWGGGLNLFNRETNNFTRYTTDNISGNGLSSNYISTVLEDSKGNFWIGTLNGLNLMKYNEPGIFTVYNHEQGNSSSLSHDFVNCIYQSTDGTLWIGTEEGLNRMNQQTGTFITYTRSNGLPDDDISGILEDDHGNLWISTGNGILKIVVSTIEEQDALANSRGEILIVSSSSLNDPDRLIIKSFNVDDGLQSKEFIERASMRSSSGEMFFGGTYGFNVFHPDSIKDNMHAPPAVFTGFQLFNKEVSLGEVFNGDTILNRMISETEEIILSHKNNVFSIEFAALNYIAPEQNKFAFKLEGFEDQWNYVDSERKASFTNLDHGEYIFRVKAANNDGVWSKEETSLRIIVTPPFWKTWWFKLLFIVIITGITFVVIELRLYTMKKQKKILEIKVKTRTEQVVEQRDQIQVQSTRIRQMNEILKKHNIELEGDLHHLSEARVMQKIIGFDEFKKIYQDESACCQFLEEIKWKSGYACKKCGSHEYCKDDVTLMRRCKKCNYKESVTCGTIFHRLRFPIDKAFYILILTSTGREINISQLSNTIDLRMKTCWEFHNKVKSIMQTRKRFKNPKEGWKELILLPKKKVKTSQ